jgi:hypothetical protein
MKIRILLPLLLALAVLQGCKSSSDSGTSTPNPSAVRLVNATSNYPSLDLTASGAVVASAVTYGSVSDYAGIASGASAITVNVAGSSIALAQSNFSLSPSISYTLVAYTSGQQLQVASFADNEVAPVSGNGKIRVMNLSPDAGSLDVYTVGAGGTLAAASALATAGYSQVTAGTYSLWITGAGNKADLRLDVPSIVISDQQVLSLILIGTPGGVLVNGVLVNQGGAVSAQQNRSARVRVVANIAANASITATANGVSVASNLRSPVVGSYTLVPAGALSMSAVVNGNNVNVGSLNAAAGADVTLLAVGDAAAPQFFLLNEDNRLPVSGMAKLRLVNGINGLGDNISLTADYSLLASDVAPGTVSATASVNSGTIFRLEVNASQANTSLYLATDVRVQSPGVYSLFMLGNNAAPVGVLRRDR